MTVVNPKSISGITSITTASGSDNLLTIHTNNGTERLRVDSTGATKIVTGIVTSLTAVSSAKVGSGVTLSPDGDIFTTGVTTATTFVGALTGNVTGNISGGTVAGSTGTFTGNVAVSGANITLQDSGGASDDRLTFGAGTDLSIYHDGTNSRIVESGAGALMIQGNYVDINTVDGSALKARFIDSGAVELYHNNIKKVETHVQGAAIASAGMTIPAMNSFSSQILVGASGFIGNYHDGTTNQQLIVGTNQYFDSAYKSRTNAVSAHIQFYERTFRFNTAAAPGSAGGTFTQQQALRIDTDGVKFGTDTAAANALDDYEEGTWTPGAEGFTIASTVSARYTKVGRLVTVNAYINAATGNGASTVNITNLPFTVYGGSNYHYGSGRLGTGSYNNSQMNIAFQVQQGTNKVKPYVNDGGINEQMISGSHILFSATYEAA